MSQATQQFRATTEEPKKEEAKPTIPEAAVEGTGQDNKAIIRSQWKTFISTMKMIDLVTTEFQSPFHPQTIIFVFKTDTVLETLKTFAKYHILSVPVYDPKTNQFEGVVDILDLVTYVTSKMNTISLQQPELQTAAADELLSQTVEYLMGISERNFWVTAKEDAPISLALDLLGNKDLHRLMILDPEGKRVKAVACQTNVIRWLRANWGKLGLDLTPSGGEERTVPITATISTSVGFRWDLPLVEQFANLNVENLQVFDKTEPVIKAFRAMYDNRVSAVAVVDPNLGRQLWGRGTLSATDLKGMLADPRNIWSLLNLSIEDYLKKLEKDEEEKIKPGLLTGSNILGIQQPIKQWRCRKQDTMFDVINKLTQSGVHRLWVVDVEDKPIGVVSLGDVIKVFSQL